MSARDLALPPGRSMLRLATMCLGVVLGASACGAAARTAPRVAAAETPVVEPSACETGTTAYERRDFAAAAEAFDQCIEANPRLAYAYYRAGLAYYEINRPDLMISRFETFMRLAPDAPERPQVETILKTAAARR